jgi:hypothetical protein
MLPFIPAHMSAEQKGLEDSAMGDGVHSKVSVEQPITVQDQSSQTTYHPKNGEKSCPCCQFYGVPCRQVRATENEATTRRNQRLFSSTKRKRSRQEQLVEDSLFLDCPSVDELQTIQKRKGPECSRDTQVKNQALYDYVDGWTITMNVIQPRGRKVSKKQAEEIMQDVMISSQGGQPSSAIHRRRLCYQCRQEGHYAKSCPQNHLPPVAPVQDPSPIPRTSGDETDLISRNCSKQDAQNDQAQQQVIPVCSDRTKHEQSKKGPKKYL